MVTALILAAGRSTRMGTPKALLPCGPGGATFLATVVTTLADGGIDDLVVVGRPGDAALKRELENVRAARAELTLRYAENSDMEGDQLSSVLTGLELMDRPGNRGMLLIPVDMPLVAAGTVRRLLEAFQIGEALIVRPVHRGRHGHPVIFSRSVYGELRAANAAAGARAVVHAHLDATVDVEVGDPGVLLDVDTPEDYARLIASPAELPRDLVNGPASRRQP